MTYPSMEDTRLAALKRAQHKAEDRSADEYTIYLTQMAMVREAAKMSGIPQWTQEHTIGALFSAQVIKSGVQMLRDMGMLDTRAALALRTLCDEQEITSVQMEEGPS